MSYNIILNSSNVANNTNSIYRYKFITGNFTVKGNASICVSQIQIPYSWFNITSAYQNNVFNIIDWLGTTRTITLPDGFYTIADINQFCESYFINNGMYLINSAGLNVYYFQIYTNAQYYRNQTLFYAVPSTLPSGWTQPSNWIGYPGSATCPQLQILTNNFRTYSGFNAGTYGGGSVASSVLSQNVPVGSTVNSMVVKCNLVSNEVGFPTDILDTFAVEGVFGENINYDPKFQKWVKLSSGTYNSLTIEFQDQNFNPVTIIDNNLTISLLLKNE